MHSLLLVTKQWNLAAQISSISSKNELYLNHTANLDDIELFANKTQTSAIIIDLSSYDDEKPIINLIIKIKNYFLGPIIAFSVEYTSNLEKALISSGIDDYFTTPITAERIMLRTLAKISIYNNLIVGAIKKNRKEIYKGFEINLKHFQVKYNGKKLVFTPKEFNLFYYLVRHHDQVLSREQIFYGVWQEDRNDGDTYISSRIVDMHVSHVRDKLKALKNNDVQIHTVRGFGYILN